MNYILPFTLFAVALSFKDVFIKQSLIVGNSIGVTMIVMGLSFLFTSVLYSILINKEKPCLRERFSIKRLLVNLIANISMVYSLSYLDATTVNVLNKSTIPILIILGGLFGYSYSKKEKVVSYILIGLVFIYSLSLLLFEKYSQIGILIFYVSLFAICIEFLFLAKSTIKGTIFDQVLSPSIALIVGGVAVFFGIQSGTLSLKFDLNTHLYTVLAGIALFFAYSSSAMRYKLLPPGIADSPTIVAFLFIYIFEVLLGTKIFNYIEILAASIIMLFSIWLVMAKVQEAKKGVVFE